MLNRAIMLASLATVMLTACGSSEPPEVVEQIVVREVEGLGPFDTGDEDVADFVPGDEPD